MARKEGYQPVRVERVRHLQDRGSPKHWRTDFVPTDQAFVERPAGSSARERFTNPGDILSWLASIERTDIARLFAIKACAISVPAFLPSLISNHPRRRGTYTQQDSAVALRIFQTCVGLHLKYSDETFTFPADFTAPTTSARYRPYYLAVSEQAAKCVQQTGLEAAASAADAIHNLIAHSGATETQDILSLYNDLADRIEQTDRFNTSATTPLWTVSVPPWFQAAWARVANSLLVSNPDWLPWIQWYDGVFFNKSTNGGRLEEAVSNLPVERWVGKPRDVLRDVLLLFSDEKGIDTNQEQGLDRTPSIPLPQPAALEPLIVNNRVTLPKKKAEAALEPEPLSAALNALRAQIEDLVADLSEEINTDRRLTIYLRELCSRFPNNAPPQHILFGLAHQIETLELYSSTVNLEWSPFLAAKYHSLVRAFDHTMLQFDSWKAFRRNVDTSRIADADTNKPVILAGEISRILNTDFSAYFDKEVPDALDQLASIKEATPLGQNSKELAADILDSINNILKKLASNGLRILRPAGGLIVSVAKNFGQAFSGQITKEAESSGKHLAAWTAQVFLGLTTSSISGIGVTVLSHLTSSFPHYFSWLTPVVTFFSTIGITSLKKRN